MSSMSQFFVFCLFFISVSVSAVVPPDGSRNCSCFDHEVAIMLNDAHTFMEQQSASTLTAYLNEQNDTETTRQYIHKYFMDSFHLWYSLYDNIEEQHFWDTACKLRWPIGFYFGHTASFYANKLRMNNIMNRDHTDDQLYDEYDYLFAQGVDEMTWNDFRPQYPPSHYPDVNKVKQYVRDTKDVVSNIILTAPLNTLPITKADAVWWTILMGIEHERIHLETSGVLIRHMPLHAFKSQINDVWSHIYEGSEALEENIPPENELVAIKGRHITFGRASDELLSNSVADFFGWDAESGACAVTVPDFNVSKYMVSNYEYYEFYQNDGYLKREFWSDEAWKWLQDTDTKYPKFWIQTDGDSCGFKLRHTFTEVEMSLAWNLAVITNHYEADAFIRWKAKKWNKKLRLITEDEWNILRTLDEGMQFAQTDIRQWDEIYGEFIANTNFYYYASEAPVDIFEFGQSSIYDVVGNVWHHTASQFHPFEGYEVDPLYAEFTTPFFNSSYFLMKGGSFLSSGNMAMLYNRNQWFRAHYFQAAGIRYVESESEQFVMNKGKQTTEEYFRHTDESNAAVYEHIHSGFVSEYKDVVVNVVHKYVFREEGKRKDISILNVGCAIGGVTYELLRKYPFIEHITGVDNRARFIGLASQMTQNKLLKYKMKNEFGEEKQHSVSLKQLQMETLPFSKIRFVHDKDLSILVDGFESKYDLIVGENMFGRYYDKVRDNEVTLDQLLDTNGIIILFEDYRWNAGGVNVVDAMQDILGKDMVLKQQFDTVPISQHVYESSRITKQYTLHCTVWIKS